MEQKIERNTEFPNKNDEYKRDAEFTFCVNNILCHCSCRNKRYVYKYINS